MATSTLTGSTFDQTVLGNEIVLVDFWAEWCGPCRNFAPVYEAAAAENPDIVFGKVDTEAEQALAGAAGISSIPTLMAFREGILVFSQPGALPRKALDQVIAGVKGLDMAEVRAAVAAAQAEHDHAAHDDAAHDHSDHDHAAHDDAAHDYAAHDHAAHDHDHADSGHAARQS